MEENETIEFNEEMEKEFSNGNSRARKKHYEIIKNILESYM